MESTQKTTHRSGSLSVWALTLLMIIGVSMATTPASVHAAGIGLDKNLFPDGLATANRTDPTKGKQLSTVDEIRTAITSHFVEVVLGIAATVALYFILNNGFWMIASAGGEKVDEAKKGLMWALIGLVLIMLSYSIIRFVISIPLTADERTNTPAAATK